MITEIKKNERIQFPEIIIVLFVFLGVYKIGQFSLVLIIALLYSSYRILQVKHIKIHKWLLFFVSIIIVNQLILLLLDPIYVSAELILKNLVITIATSFIVIVLSDSTNENRIYKVYSFFGFIAIIGILYHSILIYGFGHIVYPLVPFKNFIDESLIIFSNGINRPVSFFLEPQHYASFILPLLYLTLKRKKLIFSILITLTIFLSTSTQGILITTLIWIYFVVFIFKEFKIRILTLLLFSVITVFVLNLNLSDFTVNKLINIDLSTDIRISRGFLIFAEMDSLVKVTGIGPGSITDYIVQTGKSLRWLTDSLNLNNFISSYSGVLVQYGIISSIFFNILLFDLYKQGRKENFGFFVIILISLFGQTLLFNSWYILYFSIFFNISSKNSRNYFTINIKKESYDEISH